jgi:hypothetical protein
MYSRRNQSQYTEDNFNSAEEDIRAPSRIKPKLEALFIAKVKAQLLQIIKEEVEKEGRDLNYGNVSATELTKFMQLVEDYVSDGLFEIVDKIHHDLIGDLFHKANVSARSILEERPSDDDSCI